jgi:hypothetical protein
MQLTRKEIHEQVYFYTLIFIAVSLPISIFASSLFQFILGINWLAEGRFREKWERLRSNRALWIFLLLYGLHLVGLFWSEDAAYGLKDIKVKLPLLILPLIVATSVPLVSKQSDRILLFFTLAVFAGSMASVMKLIGLLPGEVQGYRDLSIFIHHIRFSLMIILTLLVVIYDLFMRRNNLTRFQWIFYLVCLLWFPVFLILLKSLSGIIIGCILAIIILGRAVLEIRDPVIRFMSVVPVVMIPLLSVFYLGHAVNKYYTLDPMEPATLDTETVEGNPYVNKPERKEIENGHYVWIHVCEKEMEREWNRVSEFDYHGRTTNGNSIRMTLIRFLTSKGLRKDAAGVRQLQEDEIRAIEKGKANVIYMQRLRLYPRIYEVIWEIDRFRMGYDPNDKSIVQRYFYLDAGWKIAKAHVWFGVGTGDVKQAFRDYYESIDSPLKNEWRRRAHNQYLTFMIAFGVTGLAVCLFSLVAPLFFARRERSFLAVGFMIMILISMLNEDTLETSSGAVFAAFFVALFIFGPDYPWLRRKLFSRDG